MITLYSKDFETEYGVITSLCEALVEEERNGLFELSFVMLNTDSLFNYIKEENIVVANANDTLLNQKFRIYMTRKLMNNRVEVFARHISFDLMYDYIDNLSFENQSCQYALNQLFINSNFSKHYKGYSDIVNAQNYKMSMANILEAIGGKQGSIIDTFGNGAEILRDNENIHILNRRGNDNEVTIEYRKNLIGFELEEDTTDLVTRILPYAKYNEEETSKEITVKASYVDSDNISNYSHPYIKAIDYSEKFEEGQIPTEEKLITLAKKEYKNNKVDIPKQNFKIEFIPLSKCVGYEGLEDKISLCDTVTIIDTRYNINTQAKVIKVTFNVLKNRYESMELGEPRTSLGDVIGSEIGNNVTEDEVKDIINSTPSVNFPNTLPSKSILKGKSVGLASIELNWTFENKNYYFYELYASKTRDFTPNSFYLIHEGQTSSYLFQAKPNETWYFKVCAKNSHGNRNAFSDEISVSTAKIDANEWIEEATIGNALIGELSADKITSGTISGYYIDARNLSVTDGNGKRTLDIDSFGNVNLDAKDIKMNGEKIDLAGMVTFNDLKGNGTTVINGANIMTGTIACDTLTTPVGHDPVINLFGKECKIDARSSDESNYGTAIRLKYDDDNYYYVGNNIASVYLNGNQAFTFVNNGNYAMITAQGGDLACLEMGRNYLAYNGVGVSLANHKHTIYWDGITNKPSTFPPSTHNHNGNELYPSNVIPSSSNAYYCGSHNSRYWYVVATQYIRYNSIAGGVFSLYSDKANGIKDFFGNFSTITTNKDISRISCYNSTVEDIYNEIYETNDKGEVFVEGATLSSYQSQCLEILVNENESLKNKVTDLENRLLKLEEALNKLQKDVI